MDYTYEYFQKSADYVKKIVPWTPDVAIVLGSCLGPFADTIEDPIVIDYKDIPNFLVSTVKSPRGQADLRHRRRQARGVHVRALPFLRGL